MEYLILLAERFICDVNSELESNLAPSFVITKMQRECRYLTDLTTPQAIDSQGRAIWWCNCGNFTTTSASALKRHVEGDDGKMIFPSHLKADDDVPFFAPVAIIVVFCAFMYWKTDGNLFSLAISVVALFVSAFIANILLQRYRSWKQKKIDDAFLDKFSKVKLPGTQHHINFVTKEPPKKFIEQHIKFLNENCPEYDAEDPNLESLKRFDNIVKVFTA